MASGVVLWGRRRRPVGRRQWWSEWYPSRAEAVRVAIDELLDGLRRRQVGAAIVEGYRTQPQTDEDVEAAEAAAIRSIDEEPW